MQQGILFHTRLGPDPGPTSCSYLAARWPAARGRIRAGLAGRPRPPPHPAHLLPLAGAAGSPSRWCTAAWPSPWERVDWRGRPPQAQEDALDGYLARDRRRGFPLEAAPPAAPGPLPPGGRDARAGLEPAPPPAGRLVAGARPAGLLAPTGPTRPGSGPRRAGPLLPPPRPFGEYVAWLRGQDLSRPRPTGARTLAGSAPPTPLPLADVSPATDTAQRPQTPEDPAVDRPPGERQVELSAASHGALRRPLPAPPGHPEHRRAGGLGPPPGSPQRAGDPEPVPRRRLRPHRLRAPGRPAGGGVDGGDVHQHPPRAGPRRRRARASGPGCGACRRSRRSAPVRVHPPRPAPRLDRPPPRAPLFESIVVFENYPVGGALQEQVGADGGEADAGAPTLEVDGVRAFDRTHYPLELVVYPGAELGLQIGYDGARYSAPASAGLSTFPRSRVDSRCTSNWHPRRRDLRSAREATSNPRLPRIPSHRSS